MTEIKRIKCPWMLEDFSIQEWQQLEAKWKSEHEEVEVFRRNIKWEVVKLNPDYLGWYSYQEGSIQTWREDDFLEHFPEAEICLYSVFSGSKNKEILYHDAIIEAKIIEITSSPLGRRVVPPTWDLPEKPKKMGFHEKIYFMQSVISSACPEASWDGFFTEVPPRLGFREILEEYDIGKTRYIKGFQWLLCREDEDLVLYRSVIDESWDISSVGSGYSDSHEDGFMYSR